MKPLLFKIHAKRDADEPRVTADDAFGRGLEMALTLVLFTGAGWLLDRWLGIFPVLTIVFLVLAAVGVFTKVRYAYELTMRRLEAERSAAHEARADARQRLEDVA
jgi:F0F1-type ATP synthase assembly protein I